MQLIRLIHLTGAVTSGRRGLILLEACSPRHCGVHDKSFCDIYSRVHWSIVCWSLSVVNGRSSKSSPQLGVTLAYFGEREEQ